MRFYRPNVDRLEARRMMASDLALDYQTIADLSGAGALTTKVIPVLEPASTTLTFESVLGNPILDFALDSIIVHSQSRTVVASRFHSQLLIFNQSETGSPSITARVQLDIGIQDVKVDGSRAMVVGQSASDHTEVITVDLMQGKILNRVQLAPGSFTFSHLRGDDAWLVLNSWYRSAQADESEPVVTERADLIHLQWSDEGLTRESVLPVPAHGQWSVGDNRLLVAADTRHSDGTATTALQMYDLGLSPIVEIASLELANSFTKSLVISQDGLSASLVRGLANDSGYTTFVDLLDLSNGEIKIHQSILIEDFTEVYEHKADRVLLFGQVQSQVTAINTDLSTNDQSRQVTWQLPAGMQLTPGVMELADGRIGLTGHILTMGVFFTDQAPSQSLPDGSYLVVLEPDSARVQTYHNLEVAGKFLSVEPGTDRIGIWGWRGHDQTFTYGAIDPVKGFVTSGSVSGVDPARDMTLIFSNRLLTAAADQVALYDLGSGAPLLVAAVSETAPELKAIDMVLRLTKDGTNLDPYPWDYSTGVVTTRVRVKALEGAPEDVSITGLRKITFAPYEDPDRQPVDFFYVLTDGITDVRARIHVDYIYQEPFIEVPDFDGVPNVITTSGPSERVDTTSMIPGHNSSMPLDVNSDGQVTALDVLAIYNAINDGLASATSALIDTSGDGLIHALDALLVINYLNRDIQTAASVVANASEETLDEVRATVLKDFLARTYPDGAQPADQILVGFELMPQPRPDAIGAVYFTEEELLTLQIRNMKQPGPDWLAQSGVAQYNVGPSSLGMVSGDVTYNRNTSKPANVLRIGTPRGELDGLAHVQLVTSLGTSLGPSVVDYRLRIVDGQWQVVSRDRVTIS